MALLATALRALFIGLSCTFAPILIYNYYTYPVYSTESYTTWLCTAILGFSIHIFALALWVAYKESSNYVHAAILIFLMYWTGSVTACSYIFLQFLKLSPQEAAQDPIYHVLLRPEHKSLGEQKRKKKKNNSSSAVMAARIAFMVWASLMIAAVIYSFITVGSPFRMEVFHSPWMKATMLDCSFLSITLLVWIAYKETSWLSVSLWILLYICFGSLATCAYMTKELFQLSSQDPVYLVLLKHNDEAARHHHLSRKDHPY